MELRNVKLIVARHAEDQALAQDIWGDASLTPTGATQARHLAYTLKPLYPTHLYTSPMKRAVETAQVIEQICGLQFEVVDELQEQDFGAILSVPSGDRMRIAERFIRSGTATPPHLGPPGGETYEQLANRAKLVFHQFAAKHRARNDRVVVITHGRFLTFFVQAILELPWVGRFFLAIPNTGFLQFEIPKVGLPQLEVPSVLRPPLYSPRETASSSETEDVETIKDMLVSYWTSQIIYAGVKLGIMDLLAESPKTAGEVAKILALNDPATEKLLQALKVLDLLTQEAGGQTYTVSTKARILTAAHPLSLGSAAIMWGEEHYTAWQGLAESVRSGTIAFERVYGKPFFDWMEAHPEKATLYHVAMTSYALHDYQDLPVLYDFSQHQTLMDVGGGQGTLLAILLRAYPELQGMLVERKSAIKMATTYLTQAGVLDRCKLIEGSFFDPLPQGSDCIMLSRVIHDWDDPHARLILKNCFTALAPGGTLLLIELMVPETPKTDLGISLNLNMLAVTGGQERTEETYRKLLLESGFENITLVGVTSLVSLIKATKPH